MGKMELGPFFISMVSVGLKLGADISNPREVLSVHSDYIFISCYEMTGRKNRAFDGKMQDHSKF